MVADIKEQFNNDFRRVTASQISAAMNSECSIQMAGFEGQLCRDTVRKNACKLLSVLRMNATDAQACNAIGLC
uniref:Saposin B-type domain-containing protein n=1 Tax=Panagrolaimus superbus TaxID=310955 RepID=A0A914Y7U3_9BILA